MDNNSQNDEGGTELTVAHLASDIRQLAFEVNNLAITVGAVIDVLDLDKDELRTSARALYEAAVAKQEAAKSPESDESEKLSTENIEASGQAAHPPNAVIFGD